MGRGPVELALGPDPGRGSVQAQVPGWGLENDCNPRWPNEPSLELFDLCSVRVVIERSIVGSIYVSQDEVGTDPIPLRISDSIVDATRPDELAVGAVEAAVAHVRRLLDIVACTTAFAKHKHKSSPKHARPATPPSPPATASSPVNIVFTTERSSGNAFASEISNVAAG
jgi:hypothetical protein